MSAATVGRLERESSDAGSARLPDVRRIYKGTLDDITPGDFEFNWQLLRPGEKAMNLDHFVEGGSWDDSQSILTGSLSVRRPDPERPLTLPFVKGFRVRLRVRWASGFREVWTMRIATIRVDPVVGSVDADLEDDLTLIEANERDWLGWRKTKKRKVGYTLRDVFREVARVEGLELGFVYQGKGTRFFLGAMRKRAALAVLRAAAAKVREKEKVRLTIRMRDGKLECVPFERNKVLYQFGSKIEAAFTEEEWASDNPVTVIMARGRVGKGKAAKKVKYTAYRRDVVRRFGRVVKEKDYGRVESLTDLREKAERDLAKAIRVKRTATITARGIPFLLRNQGCRWVTTEPGWYGKSATSNDRSFVYTTGVVHEVQSPADYTMDVALKQEDIFLADERRMARELRAAARARRAKRGKT